MNNKQQGKTTKKKTERNIQERKASKRIFCVENKVEENKQKMKRNKEKNIGLKNI